jgi:hypothetical protein
MSNAPLALSELTLNELQQQVTTMTKQVADTDIAQKSEKQRVIERSIADLERHGVPVPSQLESTLEELRTEVATANSSRDALASLRRELEQLLDQINVALPKVQRPERSRGLGSVPRGFVLDGTHYATDKWIDLLRTLTRVLATQHQDQFEQILSLRGRTRPPFSRDPDTLVRAELIPGTEIYLDAQKQPVEISRIALRLSQMFGYDGKFVILEPD